MAIPPHSVPYDSALRQYPVRDLLHKSQTNITPDAYQGLAFAAAAYDMASEQPTRTDDPTAAGEAAAKAGFRTAQAEGSFLSISQWFLRSHESLDTINSPIKGSPRCDDSQRIARERIATYLLEGRSFALLAAQTPPNYPPTQELYAAAPLRARRAFMMGEKLVQTLHEPHKSWDSYATMLSKHQATFEAMHSADSGGDASRIALRGIYRALLAQRQNPAPHETRWQSYREHARFVGKQASIGLVALGLAITKPLEKHTRIQDVRRRIALKILG